MRLPTTEPATPPNEERYGEDAAFKHASRRRGVLAAPFRLFLLAPTLQFVTTILCILLPFGALSVFGAQAQSLQQAYETQPEPPAEAPVSPAEAPQPPAEAPLPAFTEDSGVPEPDYAQVAADARKIAAEIEERLIETHMTDAVDSLSVGDGVTGYPKVDEAHTDMKEMIKFCGQTGQGAGQACKFKLEIKMNTSMGNTLGQLAKGMMPGAGGVGAMGQGSSGQSGGSVPYGLYGPDMFGEKSQHSKSLGTKKDAKAETLPGTPDPLAADIEELSSAKDNDLQFNAEGGERIMEEYRGLIEEYFKRMAQEE